MLYFSLFDRKSGTYTEPKPYSHSADAVRACTNAVNDPQSPLAPYAADYDLHHVGSFDSKQGVFNDPEDGPTFIVNLSSLKAVSNDATQA